MSTALGLLSCVLYVVVLACVRQVHPVWLLTGGTWWFAAGLSLLPVGFWVGLYWALDARHPEPRRFTLGMVLLGALVQAGVVTPVLHQGFAVETWLTAGLASGWQLAGFVFVVGTVQEAALYLCLRWTIVEHPEFDEPNDGIVYGAMAGLGFALSMNWAALGPLSQVDPLAAGLLTSFHAVCQATCGGVMGAFLGAARFRSRPHLWTAAGLVGAVVLNGLLQFGGRELSRAGLDYRPEYSLALAMVAAVATFGVLLFVSQHQESRG